MSNYDWNGRDWNGRDWNDDDALLAELKDALVGEPSRPDPVLSAEKSLYTWRTIDAELAELTHDSTMAQTTVLVRSETATLRTLTFTAPGLSIELELTPSGLVGQLIPPGAGQAWLYTTGGTTESVEIDEIGCFALHLPKGERFRLVCRTEDGRRVMTNWITP